jgi:hypothetical protein
VGVSVINPPTVTEAANANSVVFDELAALRTVTDVVAVAVAPAAFRATKIYVFVDVGFPVERLPVSASAITTLPKSSRIDASVTDAGSDGSVKVMFTLPSPDVITEGETVKLPVMDAGGTTDTVTLGGCPVVPDWTVTPERLVTRRVNVVVTSGLSSAEPLLPRVMLPPPLPLVMVALAVAGVKETLSKAVVPAVIVVEVLPEAVKVVITGLALST